MANEYISREAVIKYVKDWSCGYDYIETETKGAINDIKAIPAADVRTALNIIREHCISKFPICDSCELKDWCEMVDSHLSPRRWEV